MFLTLHAADGHSFAAWASGPEDATQGVVILPEIFGITAHIQQMAAHFVRHGYRAICPALFDRAPHSTGNEVLGYDETGMRRGMALRQVIQDTDALLDIQASARALGGVARTYLTGFCWGGYLTWRTACLDDQFTAAACWYGGHIVDHCHDTPRVPVLMHFGAQDAHIPLSDVETIRQAQPDVPIHVYPDAGHAFAREGTPAWRPESAHLALERTLAFFDAQKPA